MAIARSPLRDRFSTYNEEKQKVLAEKARAEKEKERADKLEAKLRELGINLEDIN